MNLDSSFDTTARGGGAGPSNRSVGRVGAGVAMAALAVQVLLFFAVPGAGRFDKYPLAAELAARGELSDERRLDFSPLYLELVGAARGLFGDPTPPVVALQLVLAAFAAGAVAAAAARRLPGRWACVAGALVALDLGVAAHVRVLEPEIVQLACAAGCLALLPTVRPTVALLAGLLAATSLATRATLAPLYLLGVPLALYLALGWSRTFRRTSVAFLLPVLLALGLLAWRSEQLGGSVRATAMNPGTVFFEGNQPLAHGTSAVYPPLVLSLAAAEGDQPDAAHQLYRDVARADAGRPLSVAEVNRAWGGRARAALAASPRRALALVGEKLHLLFAADAPHDVRSARVLAGRLPLPSWLWSLAAAAALAALARLALARRLEEWTLELLLAGNQLAVLLVFYVSARQRLLLLPALAPLAALLLAGVASDWVSGLRRRAAGIALATLALGLAILPASERARDLARLGTGATASNLRFRALERATGLGARARAEAVVEAMADAPWLFDRMRPAGLPLNEEELLARLAERLALASESSASVALDLAEIELRLGRDKQARARLEQLVADRARFARGGGGASDPRLWLARLDARAGARDAARRTLDAALAEAPGDPFLLAERLALDDRSGGDPGERGGLRSNADFAALERYFGWLDARWLAGRALLAHGRAEAAVAQLAAVTAALPTAREAWIDLAAALGASGQLEAGADAYLHAIRLALQPLQREREIVPIFLALAEHRPDDLAAQVYALQVLFQHGRWGEARAWLAARPALARVPGVDAITRALTTAAAPAEK